MKTEKSNVSSIEAGVKAIFYALPIDFIQLEQMEKLSHPRDWEFYNNGGGSPFWCRRNVTKNFEAEITWVVCSKRWLFMGVGETGLRLLLE